LAAEEVLEEWLSQSPNLNPAVRKTKNISDLEATAHEELAKIAQKRCQVITTKGSTKDACHEGIESV